MVYFSSSTKWLWGLFTVGVLVVARPVAADETKVDAPKQADPFGAVAKRSTATDEGSTGISSAFVDSTVAVEQPYEQVVIGSMRKELDDTKAELAKTKQLIGEVIHEYKQSSATPDLPPLPDAEVRVFQMKNTSADAAADKIKLLIGTQPIRIAIDEASNGLIVFGKAEALPQVEQLVIKLEDLAVAGRDGFSAPPVSAFAPKEQASPRRTLMLRVYWIADDAPDFDVPDEYLPDTVFTSLNKLGIQVPRLVAQTATSISVEENAGAVPFSTQVPAVLFEQPMRMILNGDLSATADNRSLVDMHLTIENGGAVCEMNGSLAAPIGHFMVLGTANSVIAGTEMGNGMEMPAGRGMEGGGGMPPTRKVHRGSEEGIFTTEEVSTSPDSTPKLNSTRFAFVVQVVEAESFAPEE
ncbi:secretin N-terminal domain-containing protein [Lacipirellula sp.]|uniref:secretin N-terminal domain-containing protein n=1 Tax=Lacipirellula sp. TaxID=2691419 RepID=UPI003D0DA61D